MSKTVIALLVLLQLQQGIAQNSSPVIVGCSTPADLGQFKEEIRNLLDTFKQTIREEITSLKEEIFKRDVIIQQSLCINRTGEIQMCAGNSCKVILEEKPDRPSGYYWLKACDTCEPFQAFCDFGLNFEGTKGWMRVADLDMTDHSQQCPNQFKLITSPKRVCGKTNDGFGCDSTFFETHNIRYSKVAGRAIGYGHISLDGFDRFDRCPSCTIDQPYVDGISITHGYPRSHIWTYVGGQRIQYCPCATGSIQNMPAYIGNDYYCEVGTDTNDPLWDGEGCSGTEAPCCLRVRQRSGWFIKELNTPTTDDIEVRLCTDELFSNEDLRMESIELYIL